MRGRNWLIVSGVVYDLTPEIAEGFSPATRTSSASTAASEFAARQSGRLWKIMDVG